MSDELLFQTTIEKAIEHFQKRIADLQEDKLSQTYLTTATDLKNAHFNVKAVPIINQFLKDPLPNVIHDNLSTVIHCLELYENDGLNNRASTSAIKHYSRRAKPKKPMVNLNEINLTTYENVGVDKFLPITNSIIGFECMSCGHCEEDVVDIDLLNDHTYCLECLGNDLMWYDRFGQHNCDDCGCEFEEDEIVFYNKTRDQVLCNTCAKELGLILNQKGN